MNQVMPGGEPMGRGMDNGGGRGSRLRIAAWSAAALVLLLPLVAMQFTSDVNWSVTDFVIAATLMLGVGSPSSWR